jgi:hypothetical protein
MDRDQLLPALRILLVVEQRLGSGRDVCQRIINLVTRPVRQLPHRVELFALQPALKIGLLLLAEEKLSTEAIANRCA